MKQSNLIWILCIIGTVGLCVLTYTPLVIPAGQSAPRVLGLPRTLWAGMLVYAAIGVLIFIATRFHPEFHKNDEEGDDE